MNRFLTWRSLLFFCLVFTLVTWLGLMVVFYASTHYGYPLDPVVDFPGFLCVSLYFSCFFCACIALIKTVCGGRWA